MNILFLFAQYPEAIDGSNLHKDLPDEFCRHGQSVFVATVRERRVKKETAVYRENDRSVLRVKVGNMFDDVSKIEKALVMLSMDRKLVNQIKKYWGDVKFDLIVGSTPWTAGSGPRSRCLCNCRTAAMLSSGEPSGHLSSSARMPSSDRPKSCSSSRS